MSKYLFLDSFYSQLYSPETIPYFKSSDVEYWLHPNHFSAWISQTPTFENIESQIKHKSKTYQNRSLISSVLKRQYQKAKISVLQEKNLNSIAQTNGFTVICAHQPILFTGPLYFIYKICNTIALTHSLKAKFPQYEFIPIYYCGAEDHDMEEIGQVRLFHKRFQWNVNEKKASGRLSVSGLDNLIEELDEMFQRELFAKPLISKLKEIAQDSSTYVDFYKELIDELFRDYGLLFFNPDDLDCKTAFAPIMIKEIQEQFTLKLSTETSGSLYSKTGEVQAHARDYNLFYLDKQGNRDRIIKDKDSFKTHDGEMLGDQNSLATLIQNHPQDFSPNVLIRPLYQEFLFPNLVFVGGGSEIQYWMQLKSCFEFNNISFPLLYRRMSAQFIENTTLKKLKNLKIEFSSCLKSLELSQKEFVIRNSNSNDYVQSFLNQWKDAWKKLSDSLSPLDPQYKTILEVEHTKLTQGMLHLEQKIQKHDKLKLEGELKQLEAIYSQLFPDGGLQERNQGGLAYYFKFGPQWIQFLIDTAKSCDNHFVVYQTQ